MIVYHGTTRAFSEQFCRDGIDAHLPVRRMSVDPEDQGPGLYVTENFETAKIHAGRIGDCVIAIQIDESDLLVPPVLQNRLGASLAETRINKLEPQAIIRRRIEPDQVKIVYSRDLPSA